MPFFDPKSFSRPFNIISTNQTLEYRRHKILKIWNNISKRSIKNILSVSLGKKTNLDKISSINKIIKIIFFADNN